MVKEIKVRNKENIAKLSEILKFYDGIDNWIEYTYNKLQKGLNNTLEGSNIVMGKPNYIITS